jgi:hypothetical protein
VLDGLEGVAGVESGAVAARAAEDPVRAVGRGLDRLPLIVPPP